MTNKYNLLLWFDGKVKFWPWWQANDLNMCVGGQCWSLISNYCIIILIIYIYIIFLLIMNRTIKPLHNHTLSFTIFSSIIRITLVLHKRFDTVLKRFPSYTTFISTRLLIINVKIETQKVSAPNMQCKKC